MSENQKKLDRLKKKVGAGIFQKIMDEFSGEKIYFSFAGETDARDRSIQADYDAGLSADVNELLKELEDVKHQQWKLEDRERTSGSGF